MTYQLRRLRLHGLIERIAKTHRYRLTSFGLPRGCLLHADLRTDLAPPVLRPGLALALPATSPYPRSLRRSFDKLEQEDASWVEQAKLAA